MSKQTPSHRRTGLNPIVLIFIYLGLAIAPLALAQIQGVPPRRFQDELASGLGLAGFSMLLMEFLMSGRFRTISGRIGIDLTMRFHQLMARTLSVFILVHPFLYTTPLQRAFPWDTTGRMTLGLDILSFATGLAAWLLLLLLVITSIYRDQLPYRYEAWRFAHGLGAVLIAVFGAHHAIAAGRYSGQANLESFWLGMVGLAILTMVHVYILIPWRQSRHPYRVSSVQEVALKTWVVAVEPTKADALQFQAGQFAWLTLNRSPFVIREHPFSISSCPGDRPRIEFTIKEAGDFTSRIGSIPVGTSAFLDGPHGNLTLADRRGAGLVFVAGGVGIAPIMSMLRQLRIEQDPRPMLLIYGNRCIEQMLYGSELEAMTEDLKLDIRNVLSDPPPDWDGPKGQLDQQLFADLLSFERRDDWLYIVCGPAPMIDSVEESLGRLGIPVRQIISEKFSYG